MPKVLCESRAAASLPTATSRLMQKPPRPVVIRERLYDAKLRAQHKLLSEIASRADVAKRSAHEPSGVIKGGQAWRVIRREECATALASFVSGSAHAAVAISENPAAFHGDERPCLHDGNAPLQGRACGWHLAATRTPTWWLVTHRKGVYCAWHAVGAFY